MKPINVVVDTNVFIDAFFFNDKSGQKLLRYNNDKKINFCFNKETYQELYYIMGDMISQTMQNRNISKIMENFGNVMYSVDKIEHKIKTNYVEDKSDNKFIDCCIDGKINYLISKDIHVENVRDLVKDIKEKYNLELNILSPFQFNLQMLKLHFQK